MYRKFGLLVLLGVAATLVSSASAIIFVEETINVGTAPQALLYDSIDQKVFVANHGSASVSVINPQTNTVIATVPVDEYPSAMCWSPTSTKVYVVCAPPSGNGTVAVIDAYTNAVITSIGVDQSPAAIVWCSARNKAYCMNRTSATIAVIDCQSDQVVEDISLPNQTPNDIGYNTTNDHIYVSSSAYQQNGRVRAIDCATDQIVATITCAYGTADVEVNPVSNRVYAANTGGNTVTVINGATNQRIGNITTRPAPTPLLWATPNELFVGEYWDSTVAYLGGDELSIPTANRISVGGNPKTLLFVPDCHQVFSALDLQGQIVALDSRDGFVQTYGILERLSVGSGPQAMAYFPGQNRVFVANAWDSTVTVIRTEVGIEESGKPVRPSGPALVRALPSPAPARHMVTFSATGFAPTRLDIRDAGGRVVRSAVGQAARAWQAPATGVYFCTLSNGVSSAACKLTVR